MSTKKNDIVELLYTGYTNGKVFDSNIEADLKEAKSEAKAIKTIVVIGQNMVPVGLDKALEGKEEGKEYKIELKAKEAFGERKRTLLKTIPLKVFTDKQIMPKPGMAFIIDEALVKVVAVSGGRVITDFNNPLAGKDVSYKYSIKKILTDDKEKTSALFENLLRFVPQFDVNDKEVIVKGQKALELFVNAFKNKFIEILGKDTHFRTQGENLFITALLRQRNQLKDKICMFFSSSQVQSILTPRLLRFKCLSTLPFHI